MLPVTPSTTRFPSQPPSGRLMPSSPPFPSPCRLVLRHHSGPGPAAAIAAPPTRKALEGSAFQGLVGCGGRIRTGNLRVMSPTSYRCSTPRRGRSSARKRLPGSVLLSHGVAPAVPSPLEGLTTVFGMGTGGTPPPWPPGNLSLKALFARRDHPPRLGTCGEYARREFPPRAAPYAGKLSKLMRFSTSARSSGE